TYLGFVIGHGVVGLDPEKVRAIDSMGATTNVKSLQRFLGSVNWMGRWIRRKAEITAPLTDLLRTDAPRFMIHVENTEQNVAWKALKKVLTSFPVLRLPDFDRRFYVMADASKVAVGAML